MFCKSCGKNTGGLSLCEKCSWELENKETTAILDRLDEAISATRKDASLCPNGDYMENNANKGYCVNIDCCLCTAFYIKHGRMITEADLESLERVLVAQEKNEVKDEN